MPSSTSTAGVNISSASDARYVDLGDAFPPNWIWSNDPKDLNLDTYFSPKNANIANAFGIPTLKPIIKERTGRTFILKDDTGGYYTFNEWDGCVYKFRQKFTTSVMGAVSVILEQPIGYWDMDQQFNPKSQRAAPPAQ